MTKTVMRYDLVEKSHGMACWKEMEQAPMDGDWVRYEDIEHLLQDEPANDAIPYCESCKR